MKRKKGLLSEAKMLAIGMSIFCMSGLIFPISSYANDSMRISGFDRYETSMNILKSLGHKDEIYIATGKNFPDALSIGPISYVYEKPLLLVRESDSEIKSLQELGIKKVTIIGGINSISEIFEKKLKEKFDVERISGENRYETSRKIAQGIDNIKIGVATGEKYPDALVASSYLGKNKMPLILVDDKNSTIPEKKEAVYTFGGENSVRKTYGKRIAGKDRYDTSIKIAEAFESYENVIVVSGENFADALTSAPLSKKYNAPIILSKSDKIEEDAKKIVKNAKKVILVGGESSLTKNLEKDIVNIKNVNNSKTKKDDEIKMNEESSEESRRNDELKRIKEELSKHIEDIEKIEKDKCTKSSLNKFNEKIANAKKVFKEEKEVKKIKETIETIKEAKNILVKKGDIRELKNTIEKAKEEIKKVDDYTEKSIVEVKNLIEKISKLDFDDLDEKQVNEFVQKVNKLLKSMEKKEVISEETEVPKNLKSVKLKALGSYQFKQIKIEQTDEDSRLWLEKVGKGECKISTFEYKNQTNEKELNLVTTEENEGYKLGKNTELNSLFIYGVKENEFVSIEVKNYEILYLKPEKDTWSHVFNYTLKKIDKESIPNSNQEVNNNEALKKSKEELKNIIEEHKKIQKDKYTKSSYNIFNEKILSALKTLNEEKEIKKINEMIESLKNSKDDLVKKGDIKELMNIIEKLKEEIKKVDYYTEKSIAEVKKVVEKVKKVDFDDLDEKQVNEFIQQIDKSIKSMEKKKVLIPIKLKTLSSYQYKQIKIDKEDKSSKLWLEKIGKGECKISTFEYKNQTNKKELNLITTGENEGYKLGKNTELNSLFIYGVKEKEFISVEVEDYEILYLKPEKDAWSHTFNYTLKKVDKDSIPNTNKSENDDETTVLDNPQNGQNIEIIIETKNQKFRKGVSNSDIFITKATLGMKISDIKLKNNKNIWQNDFSLDGNKPLGWKINNGKIMSEEELKSTILSKTQIDKDRIIISAVYEKLQTNLKKVIIKKQIFDPGNQVVLDYAHTDSRVWLNMIDKDKVEFKVLNKNEILKKSSNPSNKGYKVRDEYLFLYLLEDKDYIRVKVEGYEDVFLKIKKDGTYLHINNIDKKDVPTELLVKP